uniref:ILEI/PANDER domain-containing protein n=1 Tax=Magallana gigas TaxID=29159 RepID=A0A8W8HS26_MAGGI
MHLRNRSPAHHSYRSSTQIMKMLRRKKWLTRLLQSGVLLILVVTAIINISFIMNRHERKDGYRESKTREDSVPEGDRRPAELSLGVTSSKSLVYVTVNGQTVYQDDDFDVNRGIHLLVLNQATGKVMAKQVFDTYSSGEDQAMLDFIDRISKNRILVFTIKDEGSFQLKPEARSALRGMGSVTGEKLAFRDMWIFICYKGGQVVSERHSKSDKMGDWGKRITVEEVLKPVLLQESKCPWSTTDSKRQEFCDKVEGYGRVCDCDDPAPLTFHPPKSAYPHLRTAHWSGYWHRQVDAVSVYLHHETTIQALEINLHQWMSIFLEWLSSVETGKERVASEDLEKP